MTAACKGEMAKKGPRSVPVSSNAAEMDNGTKFGDRTKAFTIAGYWTRFRNAYFLISNVCVNSCQPMFYQYIWFVVIVHIDDC